MKIKTSELQSAALDWAVAKCEGVNDEAFCLYYEPTESTDYDTHGYPEFHYSTIWAQSGPIIEREKITIQYWSEEGWRACCKFLHDPIVCCSGSTILIATMRCYVASKLGDEVDIPEELV